MQGEADLIIIPASALQHYLYCPTQFALIHVQNEWEEDQNTQIGRTLHKGFHQQKISKRKGKTTQQGVNLYSRTHGISCQPDRIDWEDGMPVPVEAKKGKAKTTPMDIVQLQAAALCLEEMVGHPIPRGRIFYWASRSSLPVIFTEGTRAITLDAVEQCRKLLSAGRTPTGTRSARCRRCSLKYICLPK